MLTNAQQTAKATLGTTFGDMLHEGRYYDPLLDDIRAFLDSSQGGSTGEVRVRLHKGNIIALGCRSPHSLLDAGRGSARPTATARSLWTGRRRGPSPTCMPRGLIARSAAGDR